jgi:glyoxylase-like metal-dependent hydrolase (beta-lactamase superfamily II)
MRHVADPKEFQELLDAADRFLSRCALRAIHPGALAIARQLKEDYDLDGVHLVLPTALFDGRHLLDLDGTEAHLIFVGPCHQAGDTIVHVPGEGVVFAGDVIFRQCTPNGWAGTYAKWFEASKRIDLGPYAEWRAPARLYANVERAYRELRHEPADTPWDMAKTFDAIYAVARARGIEVEF